MLPCRWPGLLAGISPQAMSEEFPRDYVYSRDRVVDMETIGAGACGSVKRVLVDGRLEACAKVRVCMSAFAYVGAHDFVDMGVRMCVVWLCPSAF